MKPEEIFWHGRSAIYSCLTLSPGYKYVLVGCLYTYLNECCMDCMHVCTVCTRQCENGSICVEVLMLHEKTPKNKHAFIHGLYMYINDAL